MLAHSCNVDVIGSYQGFIEGFLHTRLLGWHHRRPPLLIVRVVWFLLVPIIVLNWHKQLLLPRRSAVVCLHINKKEVHPQNQTLPWPQGFDKIATFVAMAIRTGLERFLLSAMFVILTEKLCVHNSGTENMAVCFSFLCHCNLEKKRTASTLLNALWTTCDS